MGDTHYVTVLKRSIQTPPYPSQDGVLAPDEMQVTRRCSKGKRSNSDEKDDEDGGWRRDNTEPSLRLEY